MSSSLTVVHRGARRRPPLRSPRGHGRGDRSIVSSYLASPGEVGELVLPTVFKTGGSLPRGSVREGSIPLLSRHFHSRVYERIASPSTTFRNRKTRSRARLTGSRPGLTGSDRKRVSGYPGGVPRTALVFGPYDRASSRGPMRPAFDRSARPGASEPPMPRRRPFGYIFRRRRTVKGPDGSPESSTAPGYYVRFRSGGHATSCTLRRRRPRHGGRVTPSAWRGRTRRREFLGEMPRADMIFEVFAETVPGVRRADDDAGVLREPPSGSSGGCCPPLQGAAPRRDRRPRTCSASSRRGPTSRVDAEPGV